MPGLENWGVEYCQDWTIGGLNTARIGKLGGLILAGLGD